MKIGKLKFKYVFLLLLLFCASIYYYEANNILDANISFAIDSIPPYSGENYVVLNNNEPLFTEEDKDSPVFEKFGEMDYLGRATSAFANISKDLMPDKERESIGMIKPSGWQTVKYDFIPGKYLYNRCHLIGYQLTGENANENNLITCTRQMNISGMTKFENEVANYIKKTNNHVLYRVTPLFENANLLAKGVVIEGYSIEDDGDGIKFNVFVYNVQDGVCIDYLDGSSKIC